VAYAADRNVTIVPEIEMPGHALAAIRAYPELGSAGPAPDSILSDWGIFPYIYNYDDDKTFAFFEDVLTEVMALFPQPLYQRRRGRGGKGPVAVVAPGCRRVMKALGVTNEEALQGLFTQRIATFLQAHGRRLVGWDDILFGGIPPGATVMSWHGVDGAIAAAQSGHDAVLATSPTLYFDHRQSDLASEPPGRGSVVSLHDVYAFEPAPGLLTDDQRRHILGLQANVWTEHVRTEERVEKMAFPRAAAVAEVGWSAPQRKDWAGFVARLPGELDRYDSLGLHADRSALDVKIEQQIDAASGAAQLTLSNQLGLGQIRYTTGGAAPTAGSPVYAGPLSLPLPAHLKAATFDGDRRLSQVAEAQLDPMTVRRRSSQQLKLCTEKLALNLEDDAPGDGPRAAYLVDIMNPCWIYSGQDLTGVTGLTIGVGQLPFNFQLGADMAKVILHPPRTPQGELEVRVDGCTGDLIASLPLTRASLDPAVTPLSVTIPPRAGKHDLCFTFTAKGVQPLWANRLGCS